MAATAATEVAIVDNELFDLHIPGGGLPERPERTLVIRNALRKALDNNANVHWITDVPRTTDVPQHSASYVQHVQTTGMKASMKAASTSSQTLWVSNNAEVLMSAHSLQAVESAIGAVQSAVRMVLSSESRVCRVFCNIRPPGHHAHRKKGQGFCIYNNIWAAACEARLFGVRRVAIIDWDVHHGNGTQELIIGHPTEADTFFCSIHQHHDTIWPRSGRDATRGHHGNIHCKNMRPGAGDKEMKSYFHAELLPELRYFHPELILISCGFDGHARDPIGGLCYTSELYYWMTQRLVEIANDCCAGRIVSALEGGYDLQALEESSVLHVQGLLDSPPPPPPPCEIKK